MNFRLNRIIVVLALIILPVTLQAQFTYLDVSLGNRFTTISKTDNDSYKTQHYQTNVQINGLWRFKRHFGAGITASIPVYEGGKYAIQTTGANIIVFGNYAIRNTLFKYYFTESTKVALNGRIYGGIKGNFYLDGRISIFSMTENVSFTNLGSNYGETNKFSQFAPGFSIGMNPHFGKNLYMNLNLSWDFYKYKDIGFRNGNTLEKDTYFIYAPDNYSFKFKSQVIEKATAFSINFGLGYKF
jgi:hypothetical protein